MNNGAEQSDGPTTVYSADSQVLKPGEVFRRMLSGAVRSNYLAYRLVRRDIKGEYSKAALGMFWDWLDPLIFAAIFYVLMQARVINPGDMGMPYAVFVTFGVLLYATFSDCVMLSIRIFSRSKALMQHVNVAPEAHLLAVFYRIVFNSIFRVAVMVFMAAVLGAFSFVGAIAFVAVYPLFIVASMSFGIVLAPFNAVYADLSRVAEIVLRPLRYVCPVMWILPVTDAARVVYILNPPAVFIDNLRALATSGALVTPGLFAIWILGSLVIFLAGWFIFHVSVPVLSERG